MLKTWKVIKSPVIFTAVGAAIGLIYYLVVGCPSGHCAITSNVFSSMFFTGFAGFWMSMISKGGCCCSGGACNINDTDSEEQPEQPTLPGE